MSPSPEGALQPDGRRIPEAVFNAKHVGETIVHIASLPLDVTVLTFNIMYVIASACTHQNNAHACMLHRATGMPFVGRG